MIILLPFFSAVRDEQLKFYPRISQANEISFTSRVKTLVNLMKRRRRMLQRSICVCIYIQSVGKKYLVQVK